MSAGAIRTECGRKPRLDETAAADWCAESDGLGVHRVTTASVWTGTGMWKPKTGYAYVTWYVKVKALKQTTIGGMYYSLRYRHRASGIAAPCSASASPGCRSKQAWQEAVPRRGG